jgi:hypothetical protein
VGAKMTRESQKKTNFLGGFSHQMNALTFCLANPTHPPQKKLFVGKKRKGRRERQRRGEGEKNLFSSSLCLANIFFDFRFPTWPRQEIKEGKTVCAHTKEGEGKRRPGQANGVSLESRKQRRREFRWVGRGALGFLSRAHHLPFLPSNRCLLVNVPFLLPSPTPHQETSPQKLHFGLQQNRSIRFFATTKVES